MSSCGNWVCDHNLGLLTDLYELTMAQAYRREGMDRPAVFSLFVRRLPRTRNYLLAAGVGTVLDCLSEFGFDDGAIEYLASLGSFDADFLRWLKDFRFTGDVYAVPEGTPLFPEEPLLEVVAPIAEAQLVESVVMNQVHFQTVAASRASRIVTAASGRGVIDFGLRRMHGADAGIKAARAFHIAGLTATSNVLAGKMFGIPVAGTMAHSYVQAHENEMDAFRSFAERYPETILLVDTYDTLAGVDRVISLAREMGDAFTVRGIRLDSGDLGELAVKARARLDEAGLEDVDVFASGGLDEWEIARLVGEGAPIDGFGVGTGLGVSEDAPALDIAYKLTAYAGIGRMKLSARKKIIPGRKQVYREERNGIAVADVLADAREAREGRALLQQYMSNGEVVLESDLEAARARAAREVRMLPDRIRNLEPAEEHYAVEISETLRERSRDVERRVREQNPVPDS